MLQNLFNNTPYIFNPLAIQTLAVSLGLFSLGTFTMVRGRGAPVSVVFFVLTGCMGLWFFAYSWMFGARDYVLAMWWARVAHVGIAFIPAAAYHLSVLLAPPHREKTGNRIKVLWLLGAVFAVIFTATDLQFSALNSYSWGYYPRARLSSIPFILYLCGVLAMAMQNYVDGLRTQSGNRGEKMRARSLLIGFAVGSLAVLDFIPAFGIEMRPFGYLLVAIFCAISAKTIVLYRFKVITPAVASGDIIDTMNEALIVLDADNVVRLVNEAACRLFDCGERDLVGKRPSGSETVNRAFAGALESAVRSGAVRNCEVECRLPDDSARTLNLSISILRNFIGEPLASVCVASDVTDRKRSETEREKMINELQRALEEIKTLRGLLPICYKCKKIRDDQGFWKQIEIYIEDRSDVKFTHGLCPECSLEFREEIMNFKKSIKESAGNL